MRKIIAGWLAGIWLCLLLVRLPVKAANLAEPIQAQAYVLMEQESGTVLAEGFASRRTAGIRCMDAGNGADSLGRGEHLRGGNGLADGWGDHDGFGLVESGDYRKRQRCRSGAGRGRERQCSGVCDGDERPCI